MHAGEGQGSVTVDVVMTSLADHESVIERGLTTFIEVGNALLAIRDGRLYRESHSTFEDYCRERWGWERAHAYRLMTGAETAARLSPIGDIPQPTAETQVRPLTRLPAEDQPDAWREAVEESGGNVPTQATVERIVRMRTPEAASEYDGDAFEDDVPAREIDDEYLEAEAEPVTEIEVSEPAPSRLTRAAYASSESPEWYTPNVILERVLPVLGPDGIDLDPCADAGHTVAARDYYTKADDGLSQGWYGTVYMNPPYGDAIGMWTRKLVAEYEAGHTTAAIALLPARVDTEWWQPLGWYPHCFVKGRLKFSGAENSAPFPSVLVYLGPNVDRFEQEFRDIGGIYPGRTS